MFSLVKWIILLIAILIGYIYLQDPAQNGYVHEDLGLPIEQLVNKYQYPLETHHVETEDNYILELHRIPHNGKISRSDQKIKRPSVLIMHGLLESSISFVLGGPGHSLAYYLVENGFDVWLGNARGNEYSRKHKFLDPDDDAKKFYEYSWHEIGVYDLPAMIDYVLDVTDNEKLSYIGHSQGCVSFFVMLSERPQYNEKVKVMAAMAPVVYAKEIKSWAFNIPAYFQNLIEWGHEKLETYELLPHTYTWLKIMNSFCHEKSLVQMLCTIHVGLTAGFNYPQLNRTNFPVFMSHIPAGSSMKQLLHYTQVLNSDIFRRYDFGKEQNIIKYGQPDPPLYNLNNVLLPVAMFVGNNDWLTSERDVMVLESKLPNVILNHRVDDPNFNHFDFLSCIDVENLLFKHVKRTLQSFENF